MLELGVLVSGSGTNLQAILDAVARGSLAARVRVDGRVARTATGAGARARFALRSPRLRDGEELP